MPGTIRSFSVAKTASDTATLQIIYDVVSNTEVTLYIYFLIGNGTGIGDWTSMLEAKVSRTTGQTTGMIDFANFDMGSLGTGTFDVMAIVSPERDLVDAVSNYYDYEVKIDELVVVSPGEFAVDGNTLALYHCNTGSGTVLVDDTGQHNGTLVASMWTTGSKFGTGAIHFSGSEIASVPHSPDLDLQGDFTVEAWVKLDSSKTYQLIVGKGNSIHGWRVYLKNNSVRYWINNAAYDSGYVLSAGSWYHVAVTYSMASGTITFFVNDNYEGSLNNMPQPVTTTEPMVFGHIEGDDWLVGSVDEVRISDVVRYTPQQQPSYINVTSNPNGADVFIDTISVGQTPISMYEIGSGGHEILLTKTDYEDWGSSFNVNPGETANINAVLNPLPQQGQYIWGYVTDSFAVPIQGVMVVCNNSGATVFADTDGYYDLDPQISGAGLSVTASDPLGRYNQHTQYADFDGYNPVRLDFALSGITIPPDIDTISAPHTVRIGQYNPPVPFTASAAEKASAPVIVTRTVDFTGWPAQHEFIRRDTLFTSAVVYQAGDRAHRRAAIYYNDDIFPQWEKIDNLIYNNTYNLIGYHSMHAALSFGISRTGIYRVEHEFLPGDSRLSGKAVTYFQVVGVAPDTMEMEYPSPMARGVEFIFTGMVHFIRLLENGDYNFSYRIRLFDYAMNEFELMPWTNVLGGAPAGPKYLESTGVSNFVTCPMAAMAGSGAHIVVDIEDLTDGRQTSATSNPFTII